MDKDFVKEKGLNETVARFKQIVEYRSPRQSLKEYIFNTGESLTEDGEEDQNQNGGEQQPPMGNGGGQDPNGGMMPPGQGGAPDGGGNMPPAPDNQQPPMDNGAPQDPNGGNMPPPPPPPADGGEQGGEAPMPPMGGENMGAPEGEDDIETEEMEGDDEVIDVDDLTQSQEATEYKVDGVDERLSELIKIVKDFNEKLDNNERNVKELKAEFEKRNPTEDEKLNLRSQSSFPYSEKPKDYWDKLSQNRPNYNIMYDNEVSPSDEQEKFDITKKDIEGLNLKSVSDTLNVKQNLSDYLGF